MHAKKDGSHDCDLCMYCKQVGHYEVVCMDKFMGKPKSQKATTTRTNLESSDKEQFEESGEEAMESAEIKATSSTILTQLLEQQKALAAQIMALCEEDF